MPDRIRFSAMAWLQLCTICEHAPTEVAFLGITGDPDDPLRITSLYMPKQRNSTAYVVMDLDEDPGLDNLSDPPPVGAGLAPWQYLNIWIHTHPGNCCQPSSTDEDTFDRFFGHCSHSVMLIMAQDHSCYARLRLNTKRLTLSKDLPVYFDANPLAQTPLAEPWIKTYNESCTPLTTPNPTTTSTTGGGYTSLLADDPDYEPLPGGGGYRYVGHKRPKEETIAEELRRKNGKARNMLPPPPTGEMTTWERDQLTQLAEELYEAEKDPDFLSNDPDEVAEAQENLDDLLEQYGALEERSKRYVDGEIKTLRDLHDMQPSTGDPTHGNVRATVKRLYDPDAGE